MKEKWFKEDESATGAASSAACALLSSHPPARSARAPVRLQFGACFRRMSVGRCRFLRISWKSALLWAVAQLRSSPQVPNFVLRVLVKMQTHIWLMSVLGTMILFLQGKQQQLTYVSNWRQELLASWVGEFLSVCGEYSRLSWVFGRMPSAAAGDTFEFGLFAASPATL